MENSGIKPPAGRIHLENSPRQTWKLQQSIVLGSVVTVSPQFISMKGAPPTLPAITTPTLLPASVLYSASPPAKKSVQYSGPKESENLLGKHGQ